MIPPQEMRTEARTGSEGLSAGSRWSGVAATGLHARSLTYVPAYDPPVR